MIPPSFAYPGGKHYLRKWLSAHLPLSCRTYCEPCAGRGNMFWLATTVVDAERWVINDIATSGFFRLIAGKTDAELMKIVGKTYPTREDYADFGRDPTSERATLLEPLVTFSGGGYGNGYRHEQPKAPTVAGYAGRVLDAATILRQTRAEITAHDWQRACRDLTADDFVYIDPPYMRGDVRAYSALFDHAEMIAVLKAAPFGWVLSEYPEPEYITAFGQPAATKEYRLKVSGNGESRERTVTEAVWVKR